VRYTSVEWMSLWPRYVARYPQCLAGYVKEAVLLLADVQSRARHFRKLFKGAAIHRGAVGCESQTRQCRAARRSPCVIVLPRRARLFGLRQTVRNQKTPTGWDHDGPYRQRLELDPRSAPCLRGK
jgi:hypothetical protein